ncbi:type IX secretion system membrane protein PorP/SprF [Algibacter amylolyticus]|uniref:Type IX secretion system membrane protein PorP/SprF n=1 Tax=Algibacter amylolyticus TaxID=1608400 RepID=A0A5M7AU81_9FLAO|nr:type IX secretion system membrane protein PorP/SprF [Algibacter amylolyticus]KAA5821126.1 type IX secretion system membrane protein PorP/SprF [Algibacter amylolyticus]MBB5269771.1 type IX secretion system PorP/SprF family membrane protein [Algibacter amylolyticus]TSJ72072.1 type IX secretion system membrane protein PorP/SprF [Algibacter amylolyticus]
MKFIKFNIIAIVIFSSTIGVAQQLPQFTQYMYNTISINPAYAGSREVLSVVGLHRSQWVGFKGGPITQTLSVHTPLRNDRIGLGLSLIEDDLGPQNFTYLYGDFAYNIPTGRNGKLAFGLKAGFTQFSFDTNFRLDEDNQNDPLIYGTEDRWSPNIGAGVYWSTNRVYASLSAPRILNNGSNNNRSFEALDNISYYFTAGGVIDLTKSIKFKPATLIKATNGAPVSYDLTANFLFSEKFWIGGSYRINERTAAIGGIVDFQLSRQLRVGYAYEKPTSEIADYTTGTHEILLMYEFKFLSSKLKSPRYF